jgi:hypothetical protein
MMAHRIQDRMKLSKEEKAALLLQQRCGLGIPIESERLTSVPTYLEFPPNSSTPFSRAIPS